MKDMRKDRGFTLMEIMVVIGIIGILVGSGVAAIVPFKERREVMSNVQNMASLLKQTQVKAGAVEVPSSCDAAGVSEFEIVFSGSEVNLLVKSPGGITCESDEGVLRLSNGARFVTSGSVVFKTPFGSASPTVVSICNYGIQYDLEVEENGSVSEPRRSATPGC